MNPDSLIAYLGQYTGRVKIMEVCGTHTSSIFKNGVRSLVSDGISLVSGPGCPVCVTPPSVIDALIDLSRESEVLCFGDMFRIPGRRYSLAQAKAQGAGVRLMYSPFEVVPLARKHTDTRFIVAAVGFETTAPVFAALLETLIREDIRNVSLYTALKTMPEALGHICAHEQVDAFLCPGHVSAVIGSAPYQALSEKYRKPFVIAGFEAEHILAALYEIVKQNENKRYEVKNLYPSVVRKGGQIKALDLINRYFYKTDSFWHGIGEISNSGYSIKPEYARFSANMPENRENRDDVPDGCRCADVMLGRILPDECDLFGGVCTPQNPVGPCMVSSEGACGIWRSGQ